MTPIAVRLLSRYGQVVAGMWLYVNGDSTAKERSRRRAAFLTDLAEAKALRARVAPRRSRRAKANQLHRMLTYRHC